MVRNFRYWALALLLTFASCSDSGDIDAPYTPHLALSAELPALGASGGEVQLHFSTNEPWHIETAAEDNADGWFEVTPMQGDAGENISVTVRVEENPTYLGRSFTLTIRTASLEESVEITQLKRNAIIAGENLYELTSEEQTFSIEIQANVDYEVEITEGAEWLAATDKSRAEAGLTAAEHRFTVTANVESQERTATVVFKELSSDLQDEVTVVQAAWVDPDPEREALRSIYREANGEGWTHSDNWCSDRPTGEWYGVVTDEDGHVVELRLSQNNLTGTLSKKLAELTHLRHIDMSRNELSGTLCVDFRYDDLLLPLTELETADFSRNKLDGTLSISWQNLEHLARLDLSSNDIEGSIPIQWGPMFTSGRYVELILYNNRLYGDIPQFIQTHSQWSRLALQTVRQRPVLKNGNLTAAGLDYSASIEVPDAILTLADGSRQNLRTVCSDSELTMLLHWDPTQPRSTEFVERVVRRFHALYGSMGFSVVALTPEGDAYRDAAERYVQQHGPAWAVAVDCRNSDGERPILLDEPYPNYLLFDRQGILSMQMADDIYAFFAHFEVDMLSLSHTDYLNRYFKECFGKSTYESSDYSRDKEFETLQLATKGRGINIVVMGEAFTDVDIESGMYRELMLLAAEGMFDIEPMKTYRDYFNVHVVYAVSRKPYIGTDRTQVALGTVTSTSTQVYNNRSTIDDYAYAPCSDKTRFPISCVIINNSAAAVTMLNMYQRYPNYAFIGYYYGDMLSNGVVIHETIGHALGLLGDEYWSPSLEDIPTSSANELKMAQDNGCYLNLSLTKDPDTVPWKHLIGHPNFPYVGIYEGGYGYFNVWRSENRSIMSGEVDKIYFNAICRELLVKRILTLSGEEYTFEKFLATDSDEGRPKTNTAQQRCVEQQLSAEHFRPIFMEDKN